MSMDYSGTPGEYIYSHNATGKSASGIIANGSTSERDLGAQRSAGGADRQAGDQVLLIMFYLKQDMKCG